MMMAAKPAWMQGLTPEQVAFFLALEPEQAACRGSHRHKFLLADLLPGRNLPRSVKLEKIGAVLQVTDHCARGCGRWIRYVTDSHYVIDYSTARYGGGGPNYSAAGLALPAGADRAFMANMQAELLEQAWRLQLKQQQQDETSQTVVRFRTAEGGT